MGIKDENGIVWLAVRKTCRNIGLTDVHARRQVMNIQEDEVLKSNCHEFATVQMEGTREVNRKQLFLKEDVITLWLAKISLTQRMKTEY